MNPMKEPGPGESGTLGLRERNKLEKAQRIKAAAKELFTELGYDSATMRDIAHRAHVGLGTLFNYVDDKRDLVFLVYIDDLNKVQQTAIKGVKPRASLLEQLVSFFSHLYEEFASNPTLARILLRELTFYHHGRLSVDFQQNRLRVVKSIEELVAAAQEKKHIHTRESAATIALGLFFVYAGAVRLWIADDNPNVKLGLSRLRKQFKIYINGLGPAA
ncbi:TetR/AcrR family transcriptional regulator [Pusillimonas noertemannii]|nr:TetR/AcrR family transcriptional regulator [Pusillimonas noertemannii]